MSQRMDFGQLGSPEGILAQAGVVLAPLDCGGGENGYSAPGTNITVLPTADLEDVRSHAVSGLVVAGEGSVGRADSASGFDAVVNTARAEKIPVMAFGDGVQRTLQALGVDAPGPLPPAILIHDDVRILHTSDDVREASEIFHTVQAA